MEGTTARTRPYPGCGPYGAKYFLCSLHTPLPCVPGFGSLFDPCKGLAPPDQSEAAESWGKGDYPRLGKSAILGVRISPLSRRGRVHFRCGTQKWCLDLVPPCSRPHPTSGSDGPQDGALEAGQPRLHLERCLGRLVHAEYRRAAAGHPARLQRSTSSSRRRSNGGGSPNGAPCSDTTSRQHRPPATHHRSRPHLPTRDRPASRTPTSDRLQQQVLSTAADSGRPGRVIRQHSPR